MTIAVVVKAPQLSPQFFVMWNCYVFWVGFLSFSCLLIVAAFLVKSERRHNLSVLFYFCHFIF
jgi:hypothetical protein